MIMQQNFEQRISDTLNGALNKRLIDNFKVTRRTDGSELSDAEIKQLTRPYFKMTEYEEESERHDSDEFHWEETTEQKQFYATTKLAVRETDNVKAAKAFVESIFPMLNACSETPGEEGMSLYNGEQMISAFVAGQQWLIERIYQAIPLDTLTIDGAFTLLKEFIYAIPKGWSIEQAIEHLKQIDNPKKGL